MASIALWDEDWDTSLFPGPKANRVIQMPNLLVHDTVYVLWQGKCVLSIIAPFSCRCLMQLRNAVELLPRDVGTAEEPCSCHVLCTMTFDSSASALHTAKHEDDDEENGEEDEEEDEEEEDDDEGLQCGQTN